MRISSRPTDAAIEANGRPIAEAILAHPASVTFRSPVVSAIIEVACRDPAHTTPFEAQLLREALVAIDAAEIAAQSEESAS